MFLIDTNIFLEILLDQERASECQKFLENIQHKEVFFYVSSFTIHSIEVILDRNKLHEPLIEFLQEILNIPRLKRFDTDTIEELEAVKLARQFNLDFDDAIQYYICKTLSLKIISFDRHFDQTDVKRVEPKYISK